MKTYPDDLPVDRDDEDAGLDPSGVTDARAAEADEADLIEQAMAIPLGDDERGFDR
jgi:hypothetical protein